MAGTPQIGFGATLSAVTTAKTMKNLRSVSLPGFSRDVAETTTASSTGGWRTFLGALKDAGESTMEFVYNSADHNSLLSCFAESAQTWKINVPDGATVAGTAVMTALGGPIPYDDTITQTATLKWSGVLTYP